ncbi:MAG: DUF3987 domain-containing protein [Paludibacteraceae bacterium]|nr:DUF3987 domain-containing protein [Paludibacteraceae bacterium]MBQ9297009.1 DUF3987 domain-containing protein [Paludibacteraceae bacterium]
MLKNLNSMEEQVDLRIVEYLDMQNLPESIQNMLSLAKTDQEKDMLLMATLAAASACVPNLYFRYGPTGKKYYANLQCFILASSASGKGIANQALEMMRVVDEQYPMLIAGDSTLAAWYKALEEQGGIGYMHESEGSVITDIWRNAAANYNTALRKAAEHEAISRNRVKGASEIACPRLSMLLTGTFSQYKALVPSVENGYFSRLLTLVERGSHPFEKSYVTAKSENSAIPKIVGRELSRIYSRLMEEGEREWGLTDSQKERLGEKLETEYRTLIDMLGENFHSTVIRMAVQIERMAMVLSTLRCVEEPSAISRQQSDLLCADEDYETAEMIGSKMLMHMAMAYRMIKGDEQETMPEIKSLDQRMVVFELLKPVYDNHELESEGKRQGVSRATIFRWNEKWLAEGLIIRSHRGKYQKVA